MWEVFKKEIRSFLGSFIAYIVMGVFLAITGLFMWIIKGNNVLDLGVASLQVMFNIAPYILIFWFLPLRCGASAKNVDWER